MKQESPTFAATSSTLSAIELGKYIIGKYNLSADFKCKLFRTGVNHTYILSNADTKYALRVYCYNWRSKAEIVEEIELLILLKSSQIIVSYPIKDTNGTYIQELNAPKGLRFAVLFSFADGEKVRFMTQDTCFTIGSTIAKMHMITAGKQINRITYNSDTLLQSSYNYIKQYFAEDLNEMQYIKEISSKIGNNIDTVAFSNQQKGIVHLDIWYDNMSVSNETDITLFDFDNCGNGLLILDVAYFCKQLFHIENDKKVYEQKLQAFLDGYQLYKKLTDQELDMIPDAGAAIFIHYLGVQAKRFDWSNIFLSENYLKMYVGKVASWLEYHEKKNAV